MLFSIVIPAPEFRHDLPVLESLRQDGACPVEHEILVGIGGNPPAQRNAALLRARGDWIVFLDSDCCLAPDYWQRLQEVIDTQKPDVLGGPSLLRPEATPRERSFQELLACPAITGRSAARYAPLGVLRASDESELILCNLVARAAFARKVGPFHEKLYPGEENEWLCRSEVQQETRQGTIIYDPLLGVQRPQRATWRAFAVMLFRYGASRTRQLGCGPCRDWKKHGVGFAWLLQMILLVTWPMAALGVAFLAWILQVVALGNSCPKAPASMAVRAGKALQALGVAFFYGAGQCLGWMKSSGKQAVPKPILLNEKGQILEDN